MKRLVLVLLGCTMLVGLAAPSPALAKAAVAPAAQEARIQVINLRGADIGPASYRETKTFKPDKQSVIVQGISTTVTKTSIRAKEAGWYSADKTIDRKSWIGFWVYSITFIGSYHTDGQVIDQYSDTDWAVSTTVMWSSTNERSSWSRRGTTGGTGTASAKLINAIPTPIGGIQLRQVTDSVTSYFFR